MSLRATSFRIATRYARALPNFVIPNAALFIAAAESQYSLPPGVSLSC
jgi:hypothetical protein